MVVEMVVEMAVEMVVVVVVEMAVEMVVVVVVEMVVEMVVDVEKLHTVSFECHNHDSPNHDRKNCTRTQLHHRHNLRRDSIHNHCCTNKLEKVVAMGG